MTTYDGAVNTLGSRGADLDKWGGMLERKRKKKHSVVASRETACTSEEAFCEGRAFLVDVWYV